MTKKTVKHLPRHLIGSVVFTHGLVLHTPDVVVIGIRTPEDVVEVEHWKLPAKKATPLWTKLPILRGLWLLWRTIYLNSYMRSFIDIVDRSMLGRTQTTDTTKKSRKISLPATLFPTLGVVILLLAYAEGIFAYKVYMDAVQADFSMLQSDAVVFGLTFLLIVYLFRRGGIGNYMGYHGAGHQAIGAFESGKRSFNAVANSWPFQHRCGAAVVSYTLIALLICGFFLPSIGFLLTLGLVLLLFSLSYELVIFLDRYEDMVWAKILSVPGVLLQFLVAKHPTLAQSEVATAVLHELVEQSALLKSHAASADYDLPIS